MAKATDSAKSEEKSEKKTAPKTSSAKAEGAAKAGATEASAPSAEPAAKAAAAPPSEPDVSKARERLGATGRNDACPCGSGKKYKKCHLLGDEEATLPRPVPPDAKELTANAWRLFEQRRPGAAEKEFRAALALEADLQDARVGIGMARLSAGNAAGAKEELELVLAAGEKDAEALRAKKAKGAFEDPALQPYVRAAHALGCLAYDEERYEDSVKDLERVHSIDEGTVGVEARLIASKALLKLERAADAATLLEPAAKAESNASRAQLNLALAKFTVGDEAEARKQILAALDDNPHYGKAVLGRVRRHVENVAAAGPGTLEQALLYAQTYADVWNDAAKKFLETVLDERAASRKAAPEDAAAPA
jgi:tetratricopeptide (TPR) repeat protein